jgi:hypothetical protein
MARSAAVGLRTTQALWIQYHDVADQRGRSFANATRPGPQAASTLLIRCGVTKCGLAPGLVFSRRLTDGPVELRTCLLTLGTKFVASVTSGARFG